VDVAHEAVGDDPITPRKNVTISDILEVVTDRYNVRSTDLLGKRRNRSIAFPRQLCMYLAREHTPMSLEEIGGYFGGRDHTTVLHAVRTIQTQCDNDPELGVTVQELARTLRK
jgi:chromosomal replication initiator protein